MVFVSVKVNEKGQIVIPKVLRDAYGIEPGSEISIGEKNNELVIGKKMTREEWRAAIKALPKWKVEIDIDKEHEEALDNR